MSEVTNDIRRPVMLYHGSKFRLAPWIISHFPEHKNYVEPFGGGGAVMLRKHPSYHEVYNDLDEQIVTVFRVLRDPDKAEELERRIRLTPFSRSEYQRTFEPAEDDVEIARRAITNTFLGWGSTSMEHKTGFRAAARNAGPTQLDVWNKYPDAISEFCSRFKEVVIECRPAGEVIGQQDGPETLFYLDPPYTMENRTERHAYKYDFADEDHIELAEKLRSIEGMAVISGYRCELYDELYGDWERYDKKARTQNVEQKKTESIWLNGAAQENQAQQELFDDA